MILRKIIVLMIVLSVAGIIQAATETQKQDAIDAGLKWLAGTQQADGHFEDGDYYYDVASTASALLAFMEEGYSAGTNVVIGGTNYGDVVGNGLNYLFSQTQRRSIGVEPAGNPDTNSNGYGVKFNSVSYDHSRDTYLTGLALSTIAKAATATPGAVVGSGTEAGRTYAQVVQDVVDYFAYGQADPGTWAQGGWRYYADYNQSDNSTSQWPVVGMLYAQAVGGVTVPSFVKTELRTWMDYIQNPADGGSYYDNNFGGWGSNMSRTGGWLIEASLAGIGPGGLAGTGVTQADIDAAIAYINNNWNTYANSTWNGNFGHPYAMWGVYKGLQLNIGLGDTTTITPRAQGGAVIDPGDAWNWWEDYCQYIVSTQAASGAWGGYSYWDGALATSWYINILNATIIPDGQIPIPGAFLLGSIGLAFAGRKLQRRKEF